MRKKPTLQAAAAAASAAAFFLMAGCGGSNTPDGVGEVMQRVSVDAQDTELVVHGLGSLRAGLIHLEVRSTGRDEHGIALVRLKRRLTTMQLVQAFAGENRALLEARGGVQQVAPEHTWEMTERLEPGSYALLDFAETGPKPNYARGLLKRFDVAPSERRDSPPASVGEIDMHDFRFDLRLPERFDGRGLVKISNLGETSHEISLVRIDRDHTQEDVLNLILQGVTKAPYWASIFELLSVLDPGNTAYVRFDLPPGRYVALCLLDDPGSHRLHAQLGMIGSFEVA